MLGVEKVLNEEDFLDSLDSVTWYNCLAEEIVKWKNLDNYNRYTTYGTAYPDQWLCPTIEFLTGLSKDRNGQLEVIWMICVVLFGNYGTSPRSGWIEKKDEFFAFIDGITKTYRECEAEENKWWKD